MAAPTGSLAHMLAEPDNAPVSVDNTDPTWSAVEMTVVPAPSRACGSTASVIGDQAQFDAFVDAAC